MTYSGLEIKSSFIPQAGLGVFTKRRIHKGEVVAELTGEFLTMDQAAMRDNKRYMFQYSKDTMLDSKTSDCFGKYVNSPRGTPHKSNLKWSVDYRNRKVTLKATCTIQADTELLAPYDI